MNNSHMSPQWVVENFLPDCESRYRSLYPRGECDDMELEQWEEFCADNFHEALSELLKAQKQQCADEVKAMIEMEDPHCPLDSPMYVGDEEVVIDFILAADFPEPKNRK